MTELNNQQQKINFYLEKTLSGNPTDVAEILKYLYYSTIRFDEKHWYHFADHRWNITEPEQCPLMTIIKNDLVNLYLDLATQYNLQVIKKTKDLAEVVANEDPQSLPEYLPLIINDLIYKSKLCSELCLQFSNQGFCLKIIQIAQGLFTKRDFLTRMDRNPILLGFNNGVYNLTRKQLEIPTSTHKVVMTVGYDFLSENQYKKEVMGFFEHLGLVEMLPSLASLISGERRQPMIWIKGLTEESSYALSQLINWTLGDYHGTLDFADLRKRKAPNSQHSNTHLADNCQKRIVVVEQTIDDFPEVHQPMIDILLCQNSLSLRKAYESSAHNYTPQFGLVVLSQRKDTKPMDGSLVFEAKEVKGINVSNEWKLDFIKILLSYLNND